MSRLSEISFEPLEPYDGKLSCTVLRGERGSNAPDLPDITLDSVPRYPINNNRTKHEDKNIDLFTSHHLLFSIGSTIIVVGVDCKSI